MNVAMILTRGVALAMSAYHLYVGLMGTPNATIFRATHVGFALVLTFLVYDIRGTKTSKLAPWDIFLVLAAIGVAAYPIINVDYIYSRFYMVDPIVTGDWIFGTLAIVLVLEAARRLVGLSLPLVAIGFIAYTFLFTTVKPNELIDQLYLTTEGIFGIPVAVSATYLVLFVIFGAFVERAGTGKLFMDFALGIAGRAAGGPAKVAVIVSSLFGTVSGNGVANVMTTGVFTIPLMKRIGYRPAFAGAVEAVASTGGQILPPVMGASAFMMAEFMGVSYLTICGYALIPALLYYVAVYASVHFEAKRSGLAGLSADELPSIRKVLVEQGHMFVPLGVIVAVLVAGFSPQYAALWGIVSVVPAALLRASARTRAIIRVVFDALTEGAINAVLIAMACASAGVVVGIINVTGLGLSFTNALIGVAGDNVYLALFLASLAGIVVGMGIPTAPAYIVQVALIVPALVKLGIAVPAAHLFAFYFAILSGITPPVAIAVYAANGISRAGLWDGSWAAVKLGATGYIIPFMFALGPALLMIGPWDIVARSVLTAVIGATCLAASLHGYLLTRLAAWQRIALFATAFLMISPEWRTDLVGASALLLVLTVQWATYRREKVPGAAA